MSADALRELYESKAFKPAPSLWELALTHVEFASVGLEPAPESRIASGVRAEEGVSLLLGGSGSGKSSVLAAVARSLGAVSPENPSVGQFLPVFVPVIALPEAMNIETFGRTAIREVLLAIGSAVPAESVEVSVGSTDLRSQFADSALDNLARELLSSGSVRRPLTRVRDVLDRHAEAMPTTIEETHLLDTI